MNKGLISNLLRKFKLMYPVDWLRYYTMKFKNRRANNKFISEHPDVKMPPNYLMYESFQINYYKYYTESIETAQSLVNCLKKHIDLKNKKILDWGCGPGRIIRHLPDIIGNGCKYYGTDYNKRSIDWCIKNLKGMNFYQNSLTAKLPYPDNFFDVIYGISIFTHLSESLHYSWYNEVYRILKPGGIMYLTTQGNNYKVKLTNSELKKYNDNNLIIRGNVKEGHRTYSAFQPQEFMKKLFKNVEILEFIETEPENGRWLPQDVWIIKK